MGDDKAVDYMVRKMVIGEDDDTAVMFINKLGLAVPYLRAENGLMHPEIIKKDVNKIVNILGTTTAQVKTVKEITQDIVKPEFDSDDKYAEKIDDAKAMIIAKTKKMSRQNAVKTYLEALDNVKGFIADNPQISKSIMIKQALNQAGSVITDEANLDIQDIQAGINSVMDVYKLVSRINVHKGSEAD